MNKKFFFILCFLVILSLNSLSATSINDNDSSVDITKIDNTFEDKLVKESENNIIYVDSTFQENEGDGSCNNPYNTINDELIEKIPSNSTFYLSNGVYNLNSTRINKDISFIGEDKNNVIITSNSTKSIFTLETGSTVLFKNITLKDYTSSTNATIINNANLTILDCYFINNVGTTTSNNGGSIFNNGNLEIINTLFENNTASFGAAIYTKSNLSISNSSFYNNNIYNVGGAIYNLRGNMVVDDSYFASNRAVSGAAIYNAFGNLSVNNTIFDKNNAEHYFGGALYSTGYTLTTNSIFDSNQAKIDGGAITNTNNFTIINCTFNGNVARENGGAIENVPWTENENGNLTIINSTFTENAAKKGGVIINYGKVEAVGEPATVTVRNTSFEYNSADVGGVIYNEQYIDFENSVFVDNEAEEANVIFSDEKWIKSVNNNWWGKNNISLEDIGVMPTKWIILNFTNTTPLLRGSNATIQLSLNTLNDGTLIDIQLPMRTASFYANKSSFKEDMMNITSVVNNTVTDLNEEIFVNVDNQELSLKVNYVESINTKIIINPIGDILYNDNIIITGMLYDENNNVLFNTAINATINGRNVRFKTNTTGGFILNTRAKSIGKNHITLLFAGNMKYNPTESNVTVNVIKLDVNLTVNNFSQKSFGENITLTGTLTDINKNPLYNTCINVLMENKTVKIKTNSTGEFDLRTKSVNIGENDITFVFAGNDYYNFDMTNIIFNIFKEDVIIKLNSINTSSYGEIIEVNGNLTDSHNNILYNTTITIKLNNNVYKVKTDTYGLFTFQTKARVVSENNLTISYNGNDYYNSNSTTRSFNISKQSVKFITEKIGTLSSKDTLSVSGSFLDVNDNKLYNTNIQVNVNDNLFKIKTDLNGVFLLTTDKIVVGKNNVLISYNGNKYYNSNSTSIIFNVVE